MRLLFLSVLSLVLLSMTADDKVLTKDGDATVVNTTTLGKDVIGYMGATPVKIFIKNNRIEKIVALPNEETMDYFSSVKHFLLKKWNGKTPEEALLLQVDAVSGATYSSDAVKENVRLGLEYYLKNR